MRKLERARKNGAKFLNPVPTKLVGLEVIWKALPLWLRNKAETVPKVAPGPFRTAESIYLQQAESGLRVTWFGHSATLVEIDGVRVLMDPMWDERAGPVRWAGPRRFFAPTLDLEKMPEVQAVLISHDHYDHLGKETVEQLARLMPKVRWVTALGVGRMLHQFGVRKEQITELDWTESTIINGGEQGIELRVTAVPTRHFSGRSVWGKERTLWVAFVLRGARHRVFCGADSGMWDGFEAIGKEYGPFDLAMMEIGAYHELWKSIHLGPEGAADAFLALGGGAPQGLMMPIHWGLFDLALHGWREPIGRLMESKEGRGIAIFAPEPGTPTEVVAGREVTSDWWR